MYNAGKYDIAVIGAGHAGCEAALACARLGHKTLLFSISLEVIGNMPCNPNIGGTSKGHLVREIDALGGEMGKVADKTAIQIKMLNSSKGPAVHSLRAQIDRKKYHEEMKKVIEKQENLYLKQSEIKEILVENKKVVGVVTSLNTKYEVKACILATGTYLDGKIYIGDNIIQSGPDGTAASVNLAKQIRQLGIGMQKFKTGTPARVHQRSVNFDRMEVQPGDEICETFSFETEEPIINKVDCFLTYTTEDTKNIITKNIHRSPLYSGTIEGIGPRYCPSIEDKIMRFADKERHQIFIEPMGLDTYEMYPQGLSSSLPEEVQHEIYKTVLGLENVEFTRPAYAIEYDCLKPEELKLSLELKKIEGLYGAGQINGTSGYEEAAAQGLIAGINASRKIEGKEPIILRRDEAYIGVLIDDICTKSTYEPYRMMTSRAEYRLLLRQDNADQRLTELGYNIGLINDVRYNKYVNKQKQIAEEIKRVENTLIKCSDENNNILEKIGSSRLEFSTKLSDLLKRSELNYDNLKDLDLTRPKLDENIFKQAEIIIKYEGYINLQKKQVESLKKLELKQIPQDFDYDRIQGIRLEGKEKLKKFTPQTVGQASRISGVSPADITVLLLYLETYGKK